MCLYQDAQYLGYLVSFSACDYNGDGICDWMNLIIAFKIPEGIVWIPLKLGSIIGPRLGMQREPKQVDAPSLSFKT